MAKSKKSGKVLAKPRYNDEFEIVSTPKGKGRARKDANLPAGFKTIERASNWECEKNKIITGVRGPTKDVMVKGDELRCFQVESEEIGPVTVWESSYLRDLFDQTEEGDIVRIQYMGTSKPKFKDHSPTRIFKCAFKR
jgi:hypothetical protein